MMKALRKRSKRELEAGLYVACVRRSDRIVEQYGQNAADRPGCDTLVITKEKRDEIAEMGATPNGGLTLSATGVVAALPPKPIEPAPDQAPFDTAVAVIRNTYGKTRTTAQIDNTLDAMTVVMRRLFRELEPPAAARKAKARPTTRGRRRAS